MGIFKPKEKPPMSLEELKKEYGLTVGQMRTITQIKENLLSQKHPAFDKTPPSEEMVLETLWKNTEYLEKGANLEPLKWAMDGKRPEEVQRYERIIAIIGAFNERYEQNINEAPLTKGITDALKKYRRAHTYDSH